MFCIYLEEPANKAASKAHADRSGASSAELGQIVRREVGARWKKFSTQELSALKDRDDLVKEVASRYGIDKSQAQRDVDSVLQGRQI
jgi:hypothetical protein